MSEPYSSAELAALRRAYARGVIRVTYNGRTVEYASGDEIRQRIREITGEVEPSTRPPSMFRVARFTRG